MASLNPNVRNSVSDVKEIFDTDLTDEALKQWMNVAAETTDDIDDADSGNELSSQRLALIELQLSAHYASTQDPRVAQGQVGSTRFTYKGTSDTTDYWQTAVELDTTGFLQKESGKPNASISVLDGRNIE